MHRGSFSFWFVGVRREAASASGALDLARRAMERFPIEDATPTHAHAYEAACISLQRL